MKTKEKVSILFIKYKELVGCPEGGCKFTNASLEWCKNNGLKCIGGSSLSVYSDFIFKVVNRKKWMLAKIKYGL